MKCQACIEGKEREAVTVVAGKQVCQQCADDLGLTERDIERLEAMDCKGCPPEVAAVGDIKTYETKKSFSSSIKARSAYADIKTPERIELVSDIETQDILESDCACDCS